METTVAIRARVVGPFLPAQSPPCTECGTTYQKQGKGVRHVPLEDGNGERGARECEPNDEAHDSASPARGARQCEPRHCATVLRSGSAERATSRKVMVDALGIEIRNRKVSGYSTSSKKKNLICKLI